MITYLGAALINSPNSAYSLILIFLPAKIMTETYFAIKTDHFVECHVNIRSKLSGKEICRWTGIPMLTNEDVEEIVSMCLPSISTFSPVRDNLVIWKIESLICEKKLVYFSSFDFLVVHWWYFLFQTSSLFWVTLSSVSAMTTTRKIGDLSTYRGKCCFLILGSSWLCHYQTWKSCARDDVRRYKGKNITRMPLT